MTSPTPTFEAWTTPPEPGELRLIPIGGLGEFGMNAMVVHTARTLLLVDCGQLFPGDDQPGIDSVVPDFAYLEPFADQLDAVVLTHGHEDHLGALPYFLERFNVPVYGTGFTLGLLEAKLAEFEERIHRPTLITVNDFDRLPMGDGEIEVEWVPVTHSIPDACALVLHTPMGRIVHTGDFKLDPEPIDGRMTGLPRLKALGDEGVLLLLSDSTNVQRAGHSGAELDCEEGLAQAMEKTKGILFVGTFSSHIHRLQVLLDLAYDLGRKVCLAGRSMERAVRVALEQKCLTLPDDLFIDTREVSLFKRSQVMVLCTGTQGEEMAALGRMTKGEMKGLKMEPGDRLVLSSRAIPGNEVAISRMLDKAARRGVETENNDLEGPVHVSGHALRDECREMIQTVRPRHMVPVHGMFRNLLSHSKLAQEMGWPKDRVHLLEGGLCLQVKDGKVRIAGAVPVGRCFVDQRVTHMVDARVVHDRLILQEEGIVVATLLVDPDTLELVDDPVVMSRGFVVLSEDESFSELLSLTARRAFENAPTEIRKKRDLLQELLRTELRRVIRKTTQSRPMVVPMVLDAPQEG